MIIDSTAMLDQDDELVRPRGRDFAPDGDSVPRGEAVMWGDYHLVEAALLAQRMLDGGPHLAFFGPAG